MIHYEVKCTDKKTVGWIGDRTPDVQLDQLPGETNNYCFNLYPINLNSTKQANKDTYFKIIK